MNQDPMFNPVVLTTNQPAVYETPPARVPGVSDPLASLATNSAGAVRNPVIDATGGENMAQGSYTDLNLLKRLLHALKGHMTKRFVAQVFALGVMLSLVGLAAIGYQQKSRNQDLRGGSEISKVVGVLDQDVIPKQNVMGQRAPALQVRRGVETLLANSDLALQQQLHFITGGLVGSMVPASLDANRTYTLPNASGTVCLDSNNCSFATVAQLTAIQPGQTLVAGNGLTIANNTITNTGVLSLNNTIGAITVQGLTNQTVVSTAGAFITVGTAQDIAVTSTPTFAGLNLNASLAVASGGTGSVTLAANGVLVGNGTAAITSVVAGSSGLCLMSTGTAPAFGACPGSGGSGVNTVGTLNGQAKSTDGAVISGVTIYLQTADTSFPGLVSTTAQTLAGDKVFTGDLAINGGDINTTAATFNLLAANATTVSAFGAATSLDVGATTGTINIRNSTTALGTSGAVTLRNGLGSTSFTLQTADQTVIGTATAPLNLLTGNASGSGANSGSIRLDSGIATGTTGTISIANVSASALTLGRSGLVVATPGGFNLGLNNAATASILFNHSAGTGTVTLTPANPSASNYTVTIPAETGTICTTAVVCAGYSASGGSFVNLQATTPGSQQTGHINVSGTGIFGGSGNFGGTLTVTSNASIGGNTVVSGTLAVNGVQLTTTQANFSLLDSTVTTVNAFGAATTINMGAINGTANLFSDTLVVGQSGASAVRGSGNSGFTVGSENQTAGSTASGNVSFVSGNTAGITSNTGSVTIASGNATAGSSGAIAIDAGTASGATGAITLGAANASSLILGRAGIVVGNPGGASFGVASVTTGTALFRSALGSGSITLSPANPGLNAYTITLPADTGTVCLSTGNCSGGAGGANISLNNLASVAINTSLLPGSTTIDLGSNAAPFRNLHVGGTVTNNFQITGVASAARTITIPDASGTICLTSGNCVGVGGSGDILNNGQNGTVRIGSNDANPTILETNNIDRLTIDSGGAATFSGSLSVVGAATLSSTLAVTGAATLSSTLGVTGNTTLTGDIAVNGGDLTTGATTFNLLNSTATTVNAFGDASLITIGAASSSIVTPASSLLFSGAGVAVVGSADNGSVSSRALTLKTGNATTATGTSSGALSMLSGDGTGTNSSSGSITIDSGAKTGTGTTGAVNIGTTNASAITIGASTTGALSLQGNASSYFKATSGLFTTTFSFVAPTANVTLQAPALAAGTYDICTTSGNCLGGGAGGANTALSNLSGVAINTALLPGADNTIDLGSAAFSFRTLYADTSLLAPSLDVAAAAALAIGNTTATSVSICNSIACDSITVGSNADADTVTIGDSLDTVGINGTTTVTGSTTITGATGITGAATINTSGTAATSIGSASAGALSLQGNASSYFRATSGSFTTTLAFAAPTANVTLQAPALAAGTYDICTSSGNCLGGGSGGANTSLSNLSGVAINTSLLPGVDNTIDLGSAAFSFRSAYADTSVLTPLVDVASAGTLSLGTGTATGITVGSSSVTSLSVQAAAAGTISLGTANSNTITIGSSASTGTITLGQSTAANTIDIGSGATSSGAQAINIGGGAVSGTGSKAINIANGTLALGTSATVMIASGGTTNGTAAVTIGSTGAAAHTLRLQGGTGVASGSEAIILQTNSANGSIALKSGTSTGAININVSNNSGTNINTGTSTGAVSIGNSAAGAISIQSGSNITLGASDITGTLFVLDTKTDAGDPTAVNGGMYYNSNAGKFRCAEGGTWKDCDISANAVTTVGTFSASSQTNGANITGNTITFGPADTNNPGMVSTGTQTFGGAKTFAAGTSATAFRIQDASARNYLLVDTSGASISVGNTSVAGTIQVGNTTGAVAQTINIGNNATASSTTNLTIGSLIGISSTTIQAGVSTTTITGTAGGTGSFVVPAGVNSIVVDASGAQGDSPSLAGGNGGRVEATVPVTPGSTVYYWTGGRSTSNSVGGGNQGACSSGACGYGGGASDIRIGADNIASRVLVAGGGGSGGSSGGGAGGYPAGTAGSGASAGGGATQSAGGSAGGTGTAGSLGQGGTGGSIGGNGGGGGYYGGGGASSSSGGGGGSSYASSSAYNVTYTNGFKAGNGSLTITYATPSLSLDTPSTGSITIGNTSSTVSIGNGSSTGPVLIKAGSAGVKLTTAGTVAVGSIGTLTGQLHVSGTLPTAAASSTATAGGSTQAIRIQGRYAYVTTTSGLQVFDISVPTSPTSISTVAAGTLPNGLYVSGRYAYVADATGNTIRIIDINNPSSMTVLSTLAVGTTPTELYAQGRYLYVVNRGSDTMQIIDVSNPSSPVSVGSVATNDEPQGIYVVGRYAYVANYTGSTLQVIDISNPSAPTVTGSVSTGASTFASSVYVEGRYAYVTLQNGSGVAVVNISNPASPSLTTTATTATGAINIVTQNRMAYVANYGASTMSILDMSNPASPSLVGSVATGSGPRRLAVNGRYAYVANVTAGTLQIFDIGGAYVQQLETGGIDTTVLSVRNNAGIANDLSVKGGVQVGQTLQVAGNIGVTGDTILTGDLAVNGGDLTATASTLNLFNSNVTTVSMLQSATTINIGATTGTTTFRTGLTVQQNAAFGDSVNDRVTFTSQLLGGSPLVFQGATDNSFSTTLAVTDPSANNTITFPDTSGTVQLAPASGSYLLQVPGTTAANTVTPTAASVVGLTVNGTSGTAATALAVSQPGVAAGITVASANNTATNGLGFSGTFTNLISSSSFTVTNAGSLTAAGVNSGAGLLQGSLGLTVSGAAASINASSNFATNINTGTSTGAVSVGNSLAGTINVTSGSAISLVSGSASALSLQGGSAGIAITTTGNITIGTVDSTGTLLVLDTKNTSTDPSVVNGGMYYNSATHSFRCARDGNWYNCGINEVERSFVFEDDFLGGAGTLTGPWGMVGWMTRDNTRCDSPQYNRHADDGLASHDHPGVMTVVSSEDLNDMCVAGMNQATVEVATNDVIKTTVAVNGTVGNVAFRTGWTNQGGVLGTRPTSGVWWEADATTNSRWQYCYGNGTTATCANATNTTPIVTTDTWVKLQIHIVSSTAVDFIINGTRHSLTGITYDPGSTNLLVPTMAVGNRVGGLTTQQEVFVDYFHWSGNILTAGGR